MSSAYVNIFKLMQIGRGTPPPDFFKKREIWNDRADGNAKPILYTDFSYKQGNR
jgi:hypothetical protein